MENQYNAVSLCRVVFLLAFALIFSPHLIAACFIKRFATSVAIRID
jgi:hypothetical protein